MKIKVAQEANKKKRLLHREFMADYHQHNCNFTTSHSCFKIAHLCALTYATEPAIVPYGWANFSSINKFNSTITSFLNCLRVLG